MDQFKFKINDRFSIDQSDWYKQDKTPTIRAAGKADPAFLEAILAYYARYGNDESLHGTKRHQIETLSPNYTISGAINGLWESPLTAAIRANLPHNVRLLLDAGADPNGIQLRDMEDYSVRFIRGRHFQDDVSSFSMCARRALVLEQAQAKGISQQLCPLTQTELDERRRGFPRFWTEPNLPGQRLRMDRALTGLEVAAKIGSPEIFGILRAAGADESAWVKPTSDNEADQVQEGSYSVSALSRSSPVHEAIEAGNQSMFRYLLSSCGYSPNYLPRAASTICLPPLSYIIACCDLTNSGVQRCLVDLLSHPQLEPNLRTPVFNVHVLHFATAHHDPDLLLWLAASIPGGLGSAGTTALGHTLLHIASLPLTSNQTALYNPDVAESIHCARTLDSKWFFHILPSPLHIQFPKPQEGPRKPQPLTDSQRQAQNATIQLLLQWGGIDVRAEDVDGNTALHYLAGTINVSEDIVEMVRQADGGEETWENATNCHGITPRQMWCK
ncbi:uncharacterized protein N7515_003867 [Penicillium bovifimosum]|uniref:Ankyrin n=1 Tax=Penicillium bovifimosum TaxID=126998 RepID=A0A9W9L659_9EURO|nr:uncharacterized protein N7515_003867 [Penicillium bovifimosum]KAJ5139019.1 hypothetical protein N7515_003867 [Penicillium bovifimosum]